MTPVDDVLGSIPFILQLNILFSFLSPSCATVAEYIDTDCN
jgi:hypothetical protein